MGAAPVWLITVDFGSGAVDITEHCTGLERMLTAHNELRPTVNTATFTVTDLATSNLFNSGGNDMPVVITKDGVGWFAGEVRPDYDTVMTSYMERLDVECVDTSINLQEKIDESFVWSGYDVCDTGSTSTSIIHQLLVTAGYSLSDMSLTDIAHTITTYGVARFEEQVFWDEIDEILYEFGYVLDVNAAGVFIMHEMHPTSLSTSALTDADTAHMRTQSKRRQRWEAVRLTWYPVQTFIDQLVFSDRTGGDSTNPMNVSLSSGEYYPPGADADNIYSMYTYPDADILDVVNERTAWTKTGNVQLETESFGIKRADIKFLGGSGGGVLTKFEIHGDVSIRDRTQVRKEVVYRVANSTRILEHTARFIQSQATAGAFSSNIVNYYNYAKFTYEFEVVTDALIVALMSEFNLVSVAQNIDIDIRIISLREDEFGNRFATAEGISAYSLLTPEVQDVLTAPGVVAPRNDPSNPLLSDPIINAYQTASTLDGGTPSTTPFNDTFDGGAPDTAATDYFGELGNLRPQGLDMTLTGDLYVEGNTIHDANILLRDINGRLIEISRTNGIKIVDRTFEERVIQIGAGNGIKATDNEGNLIHDIPDVPVLTGNAHMGHLSWFQDATTYRLIESSGSWTVGVWTAVTANVAGNTNVKGVIVKVYLKAFQAATAAGFAFVYFRPTGSSWAIGIDSPTPVIGHAQAHTGVTATDFTFQGMVQVPIGTSDQIDYYIHTDLSSTSFSLAQVGIFI